VTYEYHLALTWASQLRIKILYIEFNGDLTKCLVAYTRSQRDIRTKGLGVQIRCSFTTSELNLTEKKLIHKDTSIQIPLVLVDISKFYLLL